MRGDGPTIFAQVKNNVNVDKIIEHIHSAMNHTKRSKSIE